MVNVVLFDADNKDVDLDDFLVNKAGDVMYLVTFPEEAAKENTNGLVYEEQNSTWYSCAVEYYYHQRKSVHNGEEINKINRCLSSEDRG